MIALSKPYLTGKEKIYIQEALEHSSGNGPFTKKCHQFFAAKYGFKKALLTTSCTDALELAALLLNIKPGDEVILPSYTFVSTANAFLLRGAKLVFADSRSDHPNLDVDSIRNLITPRTKVIVPVHYAGVGVDMDALMSIAEKFNIFVVEDAAQAIHARYKGRPLGSIGHLGCFSFHDTKNIVCGEGGLLVINDPRFVQRAEILWEKGTNRSAFIRGEVDKYGWVDVGSSFLPSELTAAFLLAQLEEVERIHELRRLVWQNYMDILPELVVQHGVSTPVIPDYAQHNAHIFYLICQSAGQRNHLTASLKKAGIQAFFHYPPLHLSRYYLADHKPELLPNASQFSEKLIRLPLSAGLNKDDQTYIINQVAAALESYKPELADFVKKNV
jgi:dTDP-4-amino-4,6-dideoxygalactose transaminase